jgi:hypothetical protein
MTAFRATLQDRDICDVPVPASIAALVAIVGVARAIDLILAEGGGYASLTPNMRDDNAIVRLLGRTDAEALARAYDYCGLWRVPLVKPWIAAVRDRQGYGCHAIAKELHVSDVAVRRWLARSRDLAAQTSLFD